MVHVLGRRGYGCVYSIRRVERRVGLGDLVVGRARVAGRSLHSCAGGGGLGIPLFRFLRTS